MKRILAVLLALILSFLLALAAGVYWLATTEPGLERLVRWIGAAVAGTTVGRATGALLDGFTLSGLAYRDAETDVQIDVLEVHWEPADLWRHVLHFRSIHAEGVRIILASKKKEEPAARPEFRLPLELDIDDLQLRNGSLQTEAGAKPIRIDRLDTAFYLNRDSLRVERLVLGMPEGAVDVSGRMGLQGERPVDLKTVWRAVLPEGQELKGVGTVAGNAERLVLRQTLEAPVAAELTADLVNPLGTLTWTAQLQVPKVSPSRIDPSWKPWPTALGLQGRGSASEAQWNGNFVTDTPEAGIARGRLQLRYKIPGEIFIETLNLELPRTGTEFSLEGTIRSLRERPAFELGAHWRNLIWPPDPKAEWRSPEGALTVSGDVRDLRFDLTGKLREYKVEAGGNLGFEPDRTRFRDVRIWGAGADVAMDGTLGSRLDFAWTLKVNDLGLWLPGGKGRIESRGTLRGMREAPAAEAELRANRLYYGEVGTGDLDLKLKAGLQSDSPFVFDLSAKDLRVADQLLDARLAGQGTRGKHRLRGQIERTVPGSPKSDLLSFEAEGGLREQAWAGRVAHFDFTESQTGRWTLDRPVAVTVAKAGSELGLACWSGGGSEACLQGSVSAKGDWQAAADLSHLPLALFREAFPETVTIAGGVNGRARLSGNGSRVRDGRLRLAASGAELRYRATEKETLRFAPEPLSIEASVSGYATDLRLSAEQSGFASIRGALQLRGPLDLVRLKEAPMTGELEADLQNLAIVDPWAKDLEALQGRFNGSLRLSGTPFAPVMELHAVVPEAGFVVPKLGIRVRSVRLEAHTLSERRIALEGRAVSGDGEVRLSGIWTPDASGGAPLNLVVKGNRFLAADLPEARVYVTPDLALALQGRTLSVRGRVTVPEASIRLPERAGAVTPSEDVILVGAGQEQEQGAGGLLVETHVDVVLGDQVRVRGSGFSGRVDGHVFIDQTPRGPVLGTGQIGVKDGKYSFYGVELNITEGRLLFAHSPVDNPTLDIQVSRRTDRVLAGLRVLGPLKKPNATLYSDVPMAQSDILAYLLTGKPLSLVSKQEGGLLQQAAASLGGPAASLLAREVASRVGLAGLFDEISVQTGSEIQGSSAVRRASSDQASQSAQAASLFLGKYLTPRLYVQYGIGLFQTGNVFRVRYDLGRHWKIQTETGVYSGGDVFFEWEK